MQKKKMLNFQNGNISLFTDLPVSCFRQKHREKHLW